LRVRARRIADKRGGGGGGGLNGRKGKVRSDRVRSKERGTRVRRR
jgi:hypothetical protein